MKKIIGGALAVLLALLGVTTLATASSAHTGDLNATSVCKPDGSYDVTYTLSISQTNLAGDTAWSVGTGNFAHTPTSQADLPGTTKGHVASTGAGTITLGTVNYPAGSTKASWAYAYTKWSDKFGKGSDGGDIALSGCNSQTAKAEITVTPPTCQAKGIALVSLAENVGLVTLDQSVGAHSQTFTANANFAFPGGSKTKVVAYTILDKKVTQDCFTQPPPVTGEEALPTTYVCVAPVNGTQTITTWKRTWSQAYVWNGTAYVLGTKVYSEPIKVSETVVVNTTDCAVPPAPCVATGPWYTEDVAPTLTPDGYLFTGSTPKPVNWLYGTTGNLQGFTGGSYTLSAVAGYQTAYRFVVNPHTAITYASVSVEPYINGWVAGQSGTFTITPSSLAWSSKIASGPGSQSQPVPLSQFGTIWPNNTLISQGFHLGSTNDASTHSVVTAVTGCLSVNFVPTKPSPLTGTDSDDDTVCVDDNSGDSITTIWTQSWTQEYVWNTTSKTYVLGEKVYGERTYEDGKATPDGDCAPTPRVTHDTWTEEICLTDQEPSEDEASTLVAADGNAILTTHNTTTTYPLTFGEGGWVEGEGVTTDDVTTETVWATDCNIEVSPSIWVWDDCGVGGSFVYGDTAEGLGTEGIDYTYDGDDIVTATPLEGYTIVLPEGTVWTLHEDGTATTSVKSLVTDDECTTEKPPTCASFSTQAEAQAAFLAGNTSLDGDNDGLACETTVSNKVTPIPAGLASTGLNAIQGAGIGLGLLLLGGLALFTSKRRKGAHAA